MGNVYWDKMYSVHIQEIDSQHERIVDFLNRAYDKLEKDLIDLKELETFFDELQEFAELHFGTEEKYFAEFKYPQADIHVAEHDKIRVKITEFKKRFLTDNDPKIIFETIAMIDDWLLGHIMEYDQKYVDFFHKHGLK